VSATRSTDPTRTTVLRDEFRRAFTTRFRALLGAIRTSVGYERDVLGLRQGAREGPSMPAALEADADDVDPAEPFPFERSARLVDAFLDWLDEQIAAGILERVPRPRIRDGAHYSGPFIRSAAERGWEAAATKLRQRGTDVEAVDLEATFGQGIARDQLELAYTRTFDDLVDVTEDMQTAIRRELTQGLAEGVNPRVMARRLTDRVDAIGITRSKTIARTETIENYNEFALQRYERAGVESVTVEAEWLATDDDRTCPICEALEGTVYTTDEARTETFTYEPDDDEPPSLDGEYSLKPPAHPSCRCSLLPVV